MRKLLSSIFLLSLLVISLWGISSWYLGTKTKESVKSFFEDTENKTQGLFVLELITYQPSLFGATVKIGLNVSENNPLVKGLTTFETLYFDVVIKNGPLLINKTGISFGSSIWNVTLDSELNTEVLTKISEFLQSKNIEASLLNYEVSLKFTFEDNIEYQMPLNLDVGDLLINGIYNSKQRSNIGSILASKLLYADDSVKIDTNNAIFTFALFDTDNTHINLKVSASIPTLNLKHTSLKQPLKLQVVSDTKISSNDGILNTNTNVYAKNTTGSVYPIKRSDLGIKMNDLALPDLYALLNNNARIENLNQQIEWTLDENAELPEGQDKIWELQDSISNLKKSEVKLISDALNIKGSSKPRVRFSLKTYSNDGESYLNGSLNTLAVSDSSVDSIKDSHQSILEHAQFNADVILDETMYEFLSSKIPLKDNKFKLIYKNNKLLMQ